MLSVDESSQQGQKLSYNWLILLIGSGCLLFVGLTIYALFFDKDVWCKTSELVAVLSLLIGFGLGAIYSFAEYFFTKGHFNKTGITFSTPWSGSKKEQWSNLVSAYYSDSMSWFVLKFQSGKVIRISSYMKGFRGIVTILRKYGFEM